ncbi:MAG: Crp/Fnr family transcriptional regulator [Clostridia bacterium]
MTGEHMDVLRKTSLFHGIPPDELAGMLDCLSPMVESYEKNEFIAMEGDRISAIYILLSGGVTLLKETVKGSSLIITKLEEGDMFGETSAFSRERLWAATVMANERCYVMRISPGNITGVCGHGCRSHRSLIQNMVGILAEKALLLNKRLQYLSMLGLRARICSFLYDIYNREKSATFRLGYNREELAQYLGTARPSLSRELGNMKNEGIIDYYKSSVKIKDLNKIIDGIT